ncbi:uncharacterized protein LOC141901003 isoform X1 [Tubulanus polymorphus]|uniref:uncharacterized protein LOC141901003 isoform X1 n=1 Tax=Tubulanus polymorphus TaxID=672921 RepID=UPI003DA22B73
MKAHEVVTVCLLVVVHLQNALSEDRQMDKRPHEFLGKRNDALLQLSKRSAPDFEDEEKRREFLGKRSREFLGKRTTDEDNDVDFDELEKRSREFLGKRRNDFLGKRFTTDLDTLEDFNEDKRAREFLGKRARDFLSKRAREFLGKRTRDFIGKRITFAQDCITDAQCGRNECCVLTAFGIRKCRGLQDLGDKCHPNSMPAPSDYRRSFSLCPCMSDLHCSPSKFVCAS